MVYCTCVFTVVNSVLSDVSDVYCPGPYIQNSYWQSVSRLVSMSNAWRLNGFKCVTLLINAFIACEGLCLSYIQFSTWTLHLHLDIG